MQKACCREDGVRHPPCKLLQNSTPHKPPPVLHSPPPSWSLPGALPLKKGAHTPPSAGWPPGPACYASGWFPTPCSLGQSLKGRETGHSVKPRALFSPSPLHSTLHKHSPPVSSLGLGVRKMAASTAVKGRELRVMDGGTHIPEHNCSPCFSFDT